MPAVDHRALARDRQRDHLLGLAADRVHELEPIDAEVVLGLRFDVHFLEPRHRTIGGRLQDAHFRRAILERADEVFGVAGADEPVAIGERDAVRVVVDHLERRDQLVRRLSAASAICLPLPSASCPSAAGRSVNTWTRTSVPAGA